jgi:hypothetical protein
MRVIKMCLSLFNTRCKITLYLNNIRTIDHARLLCFFRQLFLRPEIVPSGKHRLYQIRRIICHFRQKCCVWPILVKISKSEISRKPVQCGQVEGQTDRQDDEANSRFSQVFCEKLNFSNIGPPCLRCGLSEGVASCIMK